MYTRTSLNVIKQFRNTNSRFVSPVRQFSVFSTDDKKEKKNMLIGDTTVTTAYDAVTRYDGLKKFLNKTYLYTGGGIASTFGIGLATSSLVFASGEQLLMPTLVGGFVLAMGGAIGMGFTKYSVNTEKYLDDKKKEIEHYTSTNTIGRQLSYGALIGGMGLTTGPLLMFAGANGILAPATLATGLVFGGASMYAMKQPEGSLTIWVLH